MPKNTAKIGVFWIMQKNIPLNEYALGQSDRKMFNL